jgi:hypothetical protein
MRKIAVVSALIAAGIVILVLLDGSPACGPIDLSEGRFIPLDWCINVMVRLHPEYY